MSLFSDVVRTTENTIAALSNVFALRKTCNNIKKFMVSLEGDLKADDATQWYDSHREICFQLLNVLRSLIRHTCVHLCSSNTSRMELIQLHKATNILRIQHIHQVLEKLWLELQNTVLSTALSSRLGKAIIESLWPEVTSIARVSDFYGVMDLGVKLFTDICVSFNGHEIQPLAQGCLDLFNKAAQLAKDEDLQCARYELFQDAKLLRCSFLFTEYVLALDPNKDRIFSSKHLQTLKIDDEIMSESANFAAFGGLGTMNYASINGKQINAFSIPKSKLNIASDDSRALLAYELALLSSKRHPCLVTLLGFTMYKSSLVIAYQPLGVQLSSILHDDHTYKILSVFKKIAIAIAVTTAVEFLHSRGIVHDEIRPNNIFLTDSTLKSGDNSSLVAAKLGMFSFGLKGGSSETSTSENRRDLNRIKYIAPEVLCGNSEPTGFSDIYSMAIMLWELFQEARVPYDDLALSADDLITVIREGTRPTYEAGPRHHKWVIQLTKMSWEKAPHARPTAHRWRRFFENIIKDKQIDIQKEVVELHEAVENVMIARNRDNGKPDGKVVLKRALQSTAKNLVNASIGTRLALGRFNEESSKGLMAGLLKNRSNQKSSSHNVGLIRTFEDMKSNLEFGHSNDNEMYAEEMYGRDPFEVAEQLREFYKTMSVEGKTEEDRAAAVEMLENPGKITVSVEYCMRNGLKMYNGILISEYGVGLRQLEVSRSYSDPLQDATQSYAPHIEDGTLGRVNKEKKVNKKKKFKLGLAKKKGSKLAEKSILQDKDKFGTRRTTRTDTLDEAKAAFETQSNRDSVNSFRTRKSADSAQDSVFAGFKKGLMSPPSLLGFGSKQARDKYQASTEMPPNIDQSTNTMQTANSFLTNGTESPFPPPMQKRTRKTSLVLRKKL